MKRSLAAYWLAAALLAGCSEDPSDLPAVGTLERDRIDLVADSDEPVVEILVREGDRVARGDVLLRQDDRRARARLERAHADVAVAEAKLAEAESGPRAQQIQQGRARLAAATSAMQTIKLELDRLESLKAQDYADQNRVDMLNGQYQELTARRDEARAALDELLEGTRSEAIDQARSAYAAALAVEQDLAITVERATVTAPRAGTIESLPIELGERPAQGMPLVVLRAGPAYARVHVPEPIRTRIEPGTPALIHVDGREAPLEGSVRWVSSEAAFTPYYALTQYDRSRLSYLAEVDVPEADTLPVGVPVEVRFELAP